MARLFLDIRFGIRLLAAQPGFSAAAILTLALGIGANTAVFSVLNGYLFKPLPYPQADRLVQITARIPKYANGSFGMSLPMYAKARKEVPVLTSVAAYTRRPLSLQVGSRARRVMVQMATASLWQVLGVSARLGRVFDAAAQRPGQGQVAVLSDQLWHSAFGTDPDIVGRSIDLSGKHYRVIGVMPSHFVFPTRDFDLWVPLTINPTDLSEYRMFDFGYSVIGRLAPGADIAALKAQLQAMDGAIQAAAAPDQEFKDTYLAVIPYRDTLLYSKFDALLLLQGAVLLVLLIACINIANLLLSRVLSRSHEIAMRSALGASRSALTRQLLIEGFCLAVPGAAVGMAFGWACLRLLTRSTLNPAVGGVFNIAIDWHVGLASLGAACLAAVLASILPVRHLARTDLQALLQEGGQSLAGGRGAGRARSALVVAEIALATVLLAGAGLLLHSFVNLQNVPVGFDAEHVVTAGILAPAGKQASDTQLASEYRALVSKLQAMPGIQAAALASETPFGRYAMFTSLGLREPFSAPEGRGLDITYSAVYGDYFKALDIPLLTGRSFDARDTRTSPPVVILGEQLAKKYFGIHNAIGQQVKLGALQSGRGYKDSATWATVIGVVPHVNISSLDQPDDMDEIYVSALQFPARQGDLVLKTPLRPDALRDTLKNAAARVDPRIAIFDVQTMPQRLEHSLGQRRITLLLVLAFGGVALALAVVGIYGVLAYAVAQRRVECGIRLALGALPDDLLKLVIKQSLRLLGIGLVVGLVLAVILGFVLSSQLFGVEPYDPYALAGTAFVLATVALLASWLPARRAARLDPATAMMEQ